MEWVPSQLKEVAAQLKAGAKPSSVSVRTFIGWFGAERRGFYIVQDIRSALESLGLTTIPNFEYAYIDSDIAFDFASAETVHPAPKAGAVPVVGTQQAIPSNGTPVSDANTTAPITSSDPTYRVGKLAAANRVPLSVKPDASVAEAISLMMLNDYSQLPVMQSEATVKGIISWASIGSKLALGVKCEKVSDCMDRAIIHSSEESLFAIIESIVKNQYVLIRNNEQKIIGIVTTSDVSMQFHQLAEPFLLLGEIEQHIRMTLQSKFELDDFKGAKDPADERDISGVADLTFGEYIRLLENPDQWDKLKMKVDRKVFLKELQEVRRIRNDVMHFDPDGLSEDERQTLRKFVRFMQVLQHMGITTKAASA